MWPTLPRRLRPDRSVEFRLVPAAQRDLFDDRAGMRRVEKHPAADVHAYVAVAGELQDVTGLQLRRADSRQPGLLLASARDRQARSRPGLHHQPGAVEAARARARATVDVRAAALRVRVGHGLLRLGRGGSGVLAGAGG